MPFNKSITICWSCSRACGGCSWSQRFKPVPGWEATPVKSKEFATYIVHSCPLFDQDSTENGLKRLPKENKENGNNADVDAAYAAFLRKM